MLYCISNVFNQRKYILGKRQFTWSLMLLVLKLSFQLGVGSNYVNTAPLVSWLLYRDYLSHSHIHSLRSRFFCLNTTHKGLTAHPFWLPQLKCPRLFSCWRPRQNSRWWKTQFPRQPRWPGLSVLPLLGRYWSDGWSIPWCPCRCGHPKITLLSMILHIQ